MIGTTHWQCQTCGRWSRAKRRPKAHERWVKEGRDPEYDPERNEVPDPRNPEHDSVGGHFIECGPFAAFWVIPIEEYSPANTRGR